MTKQISGTIFDLSGAAVANAVCTVTPLDALVGQNGGARGKSTRTYTANGSGVLTIAAIEIGRYDFAAFIPATPSTAQTIAREGILSINADMGAEVTLEAALLANAETFTPGAVQQAIDAAAQAVAAAALLGEWRGPWVTATSYGLGDRVQEGGSSYIAIVAHTSGVFATDLTAERWELFAAKGVSDSGVPDGGTTGQVLTKASATDQDVAWTDPASGAHNVLDWGVDPAGLVDAQPILAAGDAAGVNAWIIPEDCSVLIATKFTPTVPVQFTGVSRATSRIVCGVDNDYAIQVTGPGISASKPTFRNLTISAHAGATLPRGLSLFDNAAREWGDINIEGALAVAIEIIQGVLPSFRNMVASGGQGTVIRINHGVTASILVPFYNCYFTSTTGTAVVFTGPSRKVMFQSCIFENCALGFYAEDSEIVLRDSWFESNTKDFDAANCMIDIDNTSSVNAGTPSTVAYASLPFYQHFLQKSDPWNHALGGMHNSDIRTLSAINVWESLLFGLLFPSAFINPNPGGSAFADIQVLRSGLFEIEYSVTFLTASDVSGNAACRVLKNPAGTPAEIAGSYGAVFIPAVTNAMGAVTRKCIIELDANDILRMQFSVSDLQLRAGAVAVATPTAATNASFIVRALGFTGDLLIAAT